MTAADLVYLLRPGDVLLYRGTSVWSALIRIKTWSDVSHCELYVGGARGQTWASRDGQGVGTYPLRRDRLVAVLRPLAWDLERARVFHRSCLGQGYDWWGLMRFFTLGQPTLDKQFCSEYVTRLLRAGGVEPFARDYDADRVSPGMFLVSSELDRVVL